MCSRPGRRHIGVNLPQKCTYIIVRVLFLRRSSSRSKRNPNARLWCVQVQTDISVDSKHQTLQGVAFPLHRDAVDALKRYKDKMINYVQLVSPCSVTYGGGCLFNERVFAILRWPGRFRAARSPKQGVGSSH